MRLIAVTTAALAALTLAACQQNEAETDEAAMSAEDAAMDASATTADGADGYGASGTTGSTSGTGSGASSASSGSGSGVQGGSGAAAQRTNDPSLDGYVADPRGPRLADGSYADDSYGDARDTAKSDAEQTNLRPRPDATGPQ